jgi:hypothetical protein
MTLVKSLSGSRYQLSTTLSELRRSLGITPSSERRPTSKDPLGPVSNGDGLRPKNKQERLLLNRERYQESSRRHRELWVRHRRKVKAIDKELQLEDIKLSSDEQTKATQSDQAHTARTTMGNGEDAIFAPPTQNWMTGLQTTLSREIAKAPAIVGEEVKVLSRMSEERSRYHFTFNVSQVVVAVEKKIIEDASGERRMVSGSTLKVGPPRFAVTWEFLANMALLVVQYAMPMNRLGNMLSSPDKKFSAGGLSRMLHYVALRFAPIYLELLDELCDSDILAGDDTTTRVLEVSRYFAEEQPTSSPPWAAYADTDKASVLAQTSDGKLAALLAKELGFEFDRRTGDGKKTAFHTTTISGV